MTTFYSVSAPLGAGKTFAAIDFTGQAATYDNRFIIAQPSKELVNQSHHDFLERWPTIPAYALHRDVTNNVSHALTEATKSHVEDGAVIFTTHAALMQEPYLHNRKNWHLIVDEAPAVFWHREHKLKHNYNHVLSAITEHPYNAAYSTLEVADPTTFERIQKLREEDELDAVFIELADRITSTRWDLYVLSEQFERFHSGVIANGRLNVFGLLDHRLFAGYATTTFMSANFDRTIAYQLFTRQGVTFETHKAITRRLRYRTHDNGHLLTIHYAMTGRWSKHRRDKVVDGQKFGQIIVNEAKNLFGTDLFAYQTNKDEDRSQPFRGSNAVVLPHSAYGLNHFQHIHDAVVIPALNPTPALYGFLDQVAQLDANEVSHAVYREAVYQTAGRISTRNLQDGNPKRIIVADQDTAEFLHELYPGSKLAALPCCEIEPNELPSGRRKKHESDTAKKAAYRDRHKAELLADLDSVNGKSASTKLPYILGQFVDANLGFVGGSMWSSIHATRPIDQWRSISFGGFVSSLRRMHDEAIARHESCHWSPAVFSRTGDTDRAIADISSMCGILLDCDDGSNMPPHEFANMFPYLIMAIYNSAGSTKDKPRYRVVIPTTSLMSTRAYEEIMRQIKDVLRRKGYFDKHQLIERAQRGLGGIDHGFDWKHVASMYGLPLQALAGPDASFFHVFEGGKRQPLDVYNWIDRTLINHRPPAENILDQIKGEELSAMMAAAWEKALEMAQEEAVL